MMQGPNHHDIPTNNARGVCLLQSQDLDGAIHIFRESLDQVRQFMSFCDVTCNKDRLQIISTNEPIQGSPQDQFLCFTQPFVVLSTEPNIYFELAEASAHDLNLLVATMLFNLALAHQLRSSSGKSPSWSHDVNKAISLYKHAVHITSSIQKAQVDTYFCGAEDRASALAVAVGNNLGGLFAEVHDFTALHTLLEWTTQQACKSKSEATTCFWTNLLSFRAINSFPAAMA